MPATRTRDSARPRSGRGAGPDPVDIHVGLRLRERRTLLGMSQSELGGRVGLTFQQIQKYERGSNRISASRLFQFAGILGIEVDHFFAGLELARRESARLGDAGDAARMREILSLVRAYYGISDGKLRNELFELVKAIADGSAEVPTPAN